MNIAIICPSLTGGGAERAAGLLSIKLSKYANVYMFLIDNKDISYEYSGELVNFNFTEKYKRIIGENGGIVKKIIAKKIYCQIIKEIKKKKIELKIDYSISFLETPNLMNIFSKVNDKIIVSVRNNRSEQNNNLMQKIENFGVKHFYNKADKVVSVSYGVGEDLIKNFKLKNEIVTTIYNFFDFNAIRTKSKEDIPEQYRQLFQKDVILTMGRLTKQKNFEGLLKAIPHVINKHPQVQFVILGSGELKEELINQIRQLKIEKYVTMIDYCKNPFPLIFKSKIFVMNSNFEGICNSIMEALACDTFVISTDCNYGPREILTGTNEYLNRINGFTVGKRGILTQVNDTINLAKAINYSLENEKIMSKCKSNAREYINRYSNDEIERKWLELIGIQKEKIY